MPAFTLEASAVSGTYDAWVLVGTTKPAAMSDSNDATWCQRGAAGDRQGFVMDDVPSEAATIDGSVTIYTRDKEDVERSDTYRPFFRYSGVDDDSATGINPTTSFTDRNTAFATWNSGTPWTPTIVNGAEAGYYKITFAGGSIYYISKMNVTGNYTPEGGGFVFMLMSLMGMMIGGSLLLSDMPGIATRLAQLKRPGEGYRIVQPYEYDWLFQELKDYRHPVRFDLGNHE